MGTISTISCIFVVLIQLYPGVLNSCSSIYGWCNSNDDCCKNHICDNKIFTRKLCCRKVNFQQLYALQLQEDLLQDYLFPTTILGRQIQKPSGKSQIVKVPPELPSSRGMPGKQPPQEKITPMSEKQLNQGTPGNLSPKLGKQEQNTETINTSQGVLITQVSPDKTRFQSTLISENPSGTKTIVQTQGSPGQPQNDTHVKQIFKTLSKQFQGGAGNQMQIMPGKFQGQGGKQMQTISGQFQSQGFGGKQMQSMTEQFQSQGNAGKQMQTMSGQFQSQGVAGKQIPSTSGQLQFHDDTEQLMQAMAGDLQNQMVKQQQMQI